MHWNWLHAWRDLDSGCAPSVQPHNRDDRVAVYDSLTPYSSIVPNEIVVRPDFCFRIIRGRRYAET